MRVMTSRIKIKFGDVEVEYEGADGFLKTALPKLLKEIAGLLGVPEAGGTKRSPGGQKASGPASITTIAQRLNAHKLPDLVLAAALSLTLKGNATATKAGLRKEMRDAVGFWKGAMATNFDKTLARLAKGGRITHSGGDNYALSPAQKEAISSRMGP
jgi:hypothetical protein